jgi:hypothetical protein
VLRAGDARRRAHHEHVSRRRAGPAPNDIDATLSRRRRSSISKAICGIRRKPRRRSSGGGDRAWRRRDVALTLSDAFCVDRYRAEFLDLIRAGTVDLVFANERELHSLYETADFNSALNAMRSDAKLAVITRSEKGCLVVTRGATEAVPASPIARLVDATGAGDLFAAGFLVGLSRGADNRDRRAARGACGRRGDPASRAPGRRPRSRRWRRTTASISEPAVPMIDPFSRLSLDCQSGQKMYLATRSRRVPGTGPNQSERRSRRVREWGTVWGMPSDAVSATR